jgi:hypothetical protein
VTARAVSELDAQREAARMARLHRHDFPHRVAALGQQDRDFMSNEADPDE